MNKKRDVFVLFFAFIFLAGFLFFNSLNIEISFNNQITGNAFLGSDYKCVDSDKGTDEKFIKSQAYLFDFESNIELKALEDFCFSSLVLNEAYCPSATEYPNFKKIRCENRCENGMCKKNWVNSTTERNTDNFNLCQDFDVGIDENITFSRATFSQSSTGQEISAIVDSCFNSSVLSEAYCLSPNSQPTTKKMNCVNGCSEGKCKLPLVRGNCSKRAAYYDGDLPEYSSCLLYSDEKYYNYSFEVLNYEIENQSYYDPLLGANYYPLTSVSIKLKKGEEVSSDLKLEDVFLFKEGAVVKLNYARFYKNLDIIEINLLESNFKKVESFFNLDNFFGRGFWGVNSSFLDSESKYFSYNVHYFKFLREVPLTFNSETLSFLSLTSGFMENPKALFFDFFVFKKGLESKGIDFKQAYFVSDEDAWSGVSSEIINKRYDFLDKYDPLAPTWVNFAFVDKQGSLSHFKQDIKDYGERADIVSFDYYGSFDWVEYETWGNEYFVINNHRIDATGDYIEIFKDVLGEQKPLWFISQGYAQDSRDEDVLKRDLRFMPYQAIVHGAKGIIFFGLHVPQNSINSESSKGNIIYPILKELEEISGFLISSPVKQVLASLDSNYNIIEPFDGIEYAVFGSGGNFLAILINRKEASVSKTFTSDNLGVNFNQVKKLYELKYEFPDGTTSANYHNSDGIKRIEKEINLNSEGNLDLSFSPYQVYILRGEPTGQGLFPRIMDFVKEDYKDKKGFLFNDPY